MNVDSYLKTGASAYRKIKNLDSERFLERLATTSAKADQQQEHLAAHQQQFINLWQDQEVIRKFAEEIPRAIQQQMQPLQ